MGCDYVRFLLISSVNMRILLHVLTVLCVYGGIAVAEDVVVAVGDHLEVISSLTGAKVRKIVPVGHLNTSDVSVLVAVTFDPSNQLLYFSDAAHQNVTISSLSLETSTVHTIAQKTGEERVEGLVLDPRENTLFWTDGFHRTIHRRAVGQDNDAEILHFLPEDRPRGIAISSCDKKLYWTNWSPSKPSIERSNYDGTNREHVIQDRLTMPHGLAVDARKQKLYWCDTLTDGMFAIERSNLDGSVRETLYRGGGQYPFALTVGKDHVYWSDWDQSVLWKLSLSRPESVPERLATFLPTRPMGLTILAHKTDDFCDYNKYQSEEPHLSTEKYALEFKEVTDVVTDAELTEHTSAVMVDTTRPETVSECPNCPRNEVETSSPCKFNNDKVVQSETLVGNSIVSLEQEKLFVPFVALLGFSLLLVFTVFGLLWQNHKLRRRPKLRRRRFVGMVKEQKKLNKQGATNQQVTLDIEDCCNMNLCETPCYEPPSRTPKLVGIKALEDKDSLLPNMEDPSS